MLFITRTILENVIQTLCISKLLSLLYSNCPQLFGTILHCLISFFMGVFQESVNSFQTNGMKEMHVINEVVYTNLSTSPKYAADQQEPLFSD